MSLKTRFILNLIFHGNVYLVLPESIGEELHSAIVWALVSIKFFFIAKDWDKIIP